MTHHLTEAERVRLEHALEKYGYDNQTQIAEELAKKGLYTNPNSARVYLSQTFSGHRPIADKLADALLSLCKDDSEIQFLRIQTTHYKKKKQTDAWKIMFGDYIIRLQTVYDTAEAKTEKLKVLEGLEELLQKFEVH